MTSADVVFNVKSRRLPCSSNWRVNPDLPRLTSLLDIFVRGFLSVRLSVLLAVISSTNATVLLTFWTTSFTNFSTILEIALLGSTPTWLDRCLVVCLDDPCLCRSPNRSACRALIEAPLVNVGVVRYVNIPLVWASGESPHYEPSGQNVSTVSQICLILVSNCFKRSQFCLKHVSDKMSQFVSILDFFDIWDTIETALIWEQFESNLRAIWDFFLRCQKGVKKVSKMYKKGFGGI